ncbi:DUF4259 domain-containing protein [Nonomuraea africana]|uniref:DUF4259 domain-containing protein n=1 Tax=Nonomuraea africana TaxID=46171 RepID=A0ABR9KVL7_9ACTN|nr:DUF4259 domain-containing protein [Nonomuraea africana]MBE1566072.1 hypothetical protein [Nonomuraea africana]
MGTWDIGPFDNDSAADWCGGLDDAPAERRAELIRQALATAAGAADYLDGDDAGAAIAAAAIVASQRGGPAITTPYAPDFLVRGGAVELPSDLAELALRALDRVVGDESEWRDLWAEAGALPEATAALAPIRAALGR